MGTQEDHLTELSDAARRAGSIVTEYINSIVDTAEREAEEIRQNADREAELARQEALDSAKRVFERINALERPLAELVETLRLEMERVGYELEAHVNGEAIGIAEEHETVPDHGRTTPSPSPPTTKSREPESEVGSDPELELELDEEPAIEDPVPVAAADAAPAAPKEPSAEPAGVEPVEGERPQAETTALRSSAAKRAKRKDDERAPAMPEDEPAVANEKDDVVADEKEPAMTFPAPAVPAETLMSKIFSRFKGRDKSVFRGRDSKSVFITTEGHCAVCQRTFKAGTEEALRLSDWRVNGDVGLCPECQSDGWQLPEGARLPFRRGGG